MEVIEQMCSWAREQMPDEQAVRCQEFVRQFYQWVPSEDLAGRDPRDLFGAALSQWRLAQRRDRGQTKLRVYNPHPEQDGWLSPYTVVEIIGDDMPFTVDSVTMELSRQGFAIDLVIHPVLNVRRGAEGELLELLPPGERAPDAHTESVIHAEVAREHDQQRLDQLRDGIAKVLDEVKAAVQDWGPMRAEAVALGADLGGEAPPIDSPELQESLEFLRWLSTDHFTFLGYREYELVANGDSVGLRALPDSGLGILRGPPSTPFTELTPKALTLARDPHPLVLTKANSRATVHRRAYLDYVGVKRYGPGGEVVGERRFLGLYTTAAYKASPSEIPMLRAKVERVLVRAGFPRGSHDAKALTDILESYPRDLLFQTNSDDLFNIAIGVLGLGERQRLRLFVRRDQLDRFMACLVCIPRDRFNTQNRERMGEILAEAFDGTHVDWSLQLSESVLVRIYYIVHCRGGVRDDYDLAQVESRLVEATRSWTDDLRTALREAHGEDEGARLHARYGEAFPLAYRADWSARSSIDDVERIATLRNGEPIITLYRPADAPPDLVRGKLLSGEEVSLSDVVPTFEHMGAKVVDERPYEVTPKGEDPVYIYDFGLQCDAAEIERTRSEFEAAFLGVWRGELEDDGLNELVIRAQLTGREISIVRAIARYLRQAGIAFSNSYIVNTVVTNPQVAALLVKLFRARFDPDQGDPAVTELVAQETERAIDAVRSLDEDRILHSFLAVLQAMLRTNYFRVGPDGSTPSELSFKLDSLKVPLLPEPKPRFEVFVYSPRVEAVHLRGGKVARGGLRWSDRREDFRTEVLGLMKAQMVKNALIVPVGSKGGFVVKRPPAHGGREAQLEEGIACYRAFLRGLLDVTDNISGGEIVPPERVVRYDEDDPYLVVAADKGTATFSDIANEVSAEYGFWLGDAFASGGSHGYDHKQMGITARGAWESVKRHFRGIGIDVQTRDFTVAGIGDMSGDVFGNAMLLSPHIRLQAAFNHMHVFLDPDPDAATGFAERKRLFELPRSSWSDYDASLISAGGGVFERSAKSIPISGQARAALGIDADELAPEDVISAILRAPVDLLFNGGVGTYVKASTESPADAGDKANDAVRVNGGELRCLVVGEGGNLGLTQRGRIEVALIGGRDGTGAMINTDAIDNVAGVNCSDHEVNIKILLGALVEGREMTPGERNKLLTEMTDAVAERVLYESYTQTQAMSIGLAQAVSMLDVHARLIRNLTQTAGLHREIEFLPSEETIAERKSARRGLLAPELAVLMAYCKINLYSELLDSDVPEDPFLAHDLERYFPPPLPERYRERMHGHRLRREIIATVVANQLVDRAGTTFAFRLAEETGASVSALAKAYAVAREVFKMRTFWSGVEELDNRLEAGTQLQMLIEARRLVERATRWLVRAYPGSIDIERMVRRYQPGAELLARTLPEVLSGSDREAFDARLDELLESGVPAELAQRAARMPMLLYAFDVVDVAEATGRDQGLVTATYFGLGSRLALDWLRDRILELPRDDRWAALARAALRDDLYTLHRSLTRAVLVAAGSDGESAIDRWSERNVTALERAMGVLEDIRASRVYDTTTLPVALREMRNLVRDAAD